MNEKVETYFENVKNWKNELLSMREILLECGLTEEFPELKVTEIE